MNLREYQGKKLFKQFNIPIPKSVLVDRKKALEINPFKELRSEEVVLKAQIPFGQRGKGGGVIFATKNDWLKKLRLLFRKKINNFKVEEILIEEKLEIKKEFYLAITLSRQNKDLMVIFSPFGGINIEEINQKYPQEIIKIPLSYKKKFFQIPKKILPLAYKLIRLCLRENAILAEINPLVLTKKNKLVAADAKVIIDENSLEKRPEFSYVELSGNIGVIGNGAGLVMATLDVLVFFGGQPANFLDIGGGADKEKMIKAIKTVLSKKGVKGMFINIFGGITRCDEIAQGIVDYYQKEGIKIPFVVRLVGTNEKEGQLILKKAGLDFGKEMEEAAKKIIRLI